MSAPCAMRCPKLVFLQNSSSVWFWSKSPVMPANRYTSDSLTVLLTRVLSPSGMSLMERPRTPLHSLNSAALLSPPIAAHGHAPVHHQGLASDVPRGLGCEEGDHVGDVVGLA